MTVVSGLFGFGFFFKSQVPLKINSDLKDQPSLFLCKGCERQKVALIEKETNQRLTPSCVRLDFAAMKCVI